MTVRTDSTNSRSPVRRSTPKGTIYASKSVNCANEWLTWEGLLEGLREAITGKRVA